MEQSRYCFSRSIRFIYKRSGKDDNILVVRQNHFSSSGRNIKGKFKHISKFISMIAYGRVAVCTDIGYFCILQIPLCMPCMPPLADKASIRRYYDFLTILTHKKCTLSILLGSCRSSENIQTVISMPGRQFQRVSIACHTIHFLFRLQAERNTINSHFSRNQFCCVRIAWLKIGFSAKLIPTKTFVIIVKRKLFEFHPVFLTSA